MKTMIALPFSLFKIVQGLCFPRKASICSYGPWETLDFSTTQVVETKVSTQTDVVMIPLHHDSLEYILERFTHVDYKFTLIISNYDPMEIQEIVGEIQYSMISSKEGYYAVALNEFGKDSYLGNAILQEDQIDIDGEALFLPDFDSSNWSQQENIVSFNAPEGKINFDVPLEFSLKRTSPDLLWLVECVLLSPWHEKYARPWVPTRRPGSKPGLSFSGGVDSTAAMQLMPENTALLYMERDFESLIRHENAHHFISELTKTGRMVLNIRSNHETIRTNHGKNPGFSTDYACMAHVILLADYLDLDAAGTGMPLENTYFFHGSTVRDFAETRFWKHHSPFFNYVGLPIYQPVAGCSEILNSKIVNTSPYAGLASSCLRSPKIGEKCESCWKCFRKNIFNGQSWSMSPEISKFLSKRPLKQGLATLYALQMMETSNDKIPTEAEDLISILDFDLSFLHDYWEPSLNLLPEKYREITTVKLNQIASPMSKNLLTIDVNLLTALRGEEQ